MNFSNGGTGQLSAIYIMLMNMRSAGRLYTTLAETGDLLRIANFSLQVLMNGLLALQVLYYSGLVKCKPKLKKG